MSKTTKADIVYNYVLNEIMHLRYKAGERLITKQLAEACNVSEIPVREALVRLEKDGYVRLIPNRGAIVIGLEKSDIVDIVQIKGVLEGYATRLSVDYLSKHDIDHLILINERLKKAADEGNYQLMASFNKEFHMEIYKHLPQKQLVQMISDLWEKWSITQRIFSVAPSVVGESYEEHCRLLELIQLRAYDEVESFTRHHKLKAVDSWLNT